MRAGEGVEVGGTVSQCQLSGRDNVAPSMRSLYLLSSGFHKAGPFGGELQFPRIFFAAAPQTARRRTWQCASGSGTSGSGALSLSRGAGRLMPRSCGSSWLRRGEGGGSGALCVPFFVACPQPQALVEPQQRGK